jgi:hypothetical protein
LYLFETASAAKESIDAIYDESHARTVIESSCFKTWTRLDWRALDYLSCINVKIAWSISNLLQMRIPESLLDNEID